jgi:hypothetical protein
MVLFPEFKDFFFQFGKIYFCVNLFIHTYLLSAVCSYFATLGDFFLYAGGGNSGVYPVYFSFYQPLNNYY